MRRNIAIVVQNIIQWYSVRALVALLKEKGIHFEILIYEPKGDKTGYLDIANSAMDAIKKDGFEASFKPKEESYCVCLEPYSNMFDELKCQYRLGYCYGAITTKPAVTFLPAVKKRMCGFFAHDTHYEELYSAYARTYIVPDLYLPLPIKHRKTNKKTVVLYLPTYHEESVPEVAEALKSLKDKYYIITKGHHGIDFLREEAGKKDVLEDIADEHYGSDQYVVPLFERADVVLSDNSGSIFDALYAKIPVAIATKKFCEPLASINPPQKTYAENGAIPFTHILNKKSIEAVLEEALSEKQRRIQSNVSDVLFPNKQGGAEAWWKILKNYLNDQVDQNYCKMHNYLERTATEAEKKVDELTQRCAEKEAEISVLSNRVKELEHDLDTLSFTHLRKALKRILLIRH